MIKNAFQFDYIIKRLTSLRRCSSPNMLL